LRRLREFAIGAVDPSRKAAPMFTPIKDDPRHIVPHLFALRRGEWIDYDTAQIARFNATKIGNVAGFAWILSEIGEDRFDITETPEFTRIVCVG